MIVCADDFGFGDDINDAILELCACRKLSAVSCAAALDRCSPALLQNLRAHEARVDVGLHLCLADETLDVTAPTGSDRLKLPSYRDFVQRAILGQIQPREIAAKANVQYAQFVEKCGRRPDFIDGHLHAHQLPGVRAGVIDFVRRLPREARPYLRNTYIQLPELWKRQLPWLKAAAIAFFGTRMLADLRAARLDTNEGFAGIYDFRDWRRYPSHLPQFVACLGHSNGLLVVHPGKIAEWRRQEFEALRAFNFPVGMPNRFTRNSSIQV